MTRRPRTAIPSCPRKPRGASLRPLEVFYGTSALYADAILRDGLRPARRSGGTFFTIARYRAIAHVKAWALGHHAAGLTTVPEGVILGIRFPPDAKVYVEQLFEFRVDGGDSRPPHPRARAARPLRCERTGARRSPGPS